ncbi:extensin-like domain-containing protein [Qipengyuania spongiae]|uniref:Extensin family protein n=1 Tax=Qipengyuania spongiae TaxID=2909673 RepID=A0ABY5SW62_9SPHN|nr:extensin family protein [Qipengyuania spongiae]UVI38752.1 extensin family protein [Qipengyuania spongiae]
MAKKPKTRISKRIGKFTGDRRFIAVLVLIAIFVGGRSWLTEHPEHDPWAPLDLTDPPGWATEAKLRALQDDLPACRAVLERSEVAFTALDPAGDGQCARPDRTRLDGYPLSPDNPPTTCPVAIALELWQRDGIDPAAQEIFGSEIARIEHLGAYSCRRLYGRESGGWSEHATGNAIDISGFVLEDGTRISVLGDWDDEGDKGRFLRRVRDGACGAFSTVLSPDYNAAHADHFHLDMSGRWSGLCR